MKDQKSSLVWPWICILSFLALLAALAPSTLHHANSPGVRRSAAGPKTGGTPAHRSLVGQLPSFPGPVMGGPFSPLLAVQPQPWHLSAGWSIPLETEAEGRLVGSRFALDVQPEPGPAARTRGRAGRRGMLLAAAPAGARGSQPDLQVPGPELQQAAGAGGRWGASRQLAKQLTELSAYPQAAPWALRVNLLLTELAEQPYATETAPPQLAELRAAVQEAESMVESVSDEALARDWRRAGFGLARRLDVWQAAAEVDRAMLARTSPFPSPHGLRARLAEIENMMASSEQGEGWRRYLKLDELHALAAANGNAPESDRDLARRVLARLDSSQLTPLQRAFVSTEQVQALGQELRPWTLDPVLTSRLLTQLEQYEASGLSSDAQELAAARRRLEWSRLPQETALGQQIEGHYRNCNLRACISADLINRLLPTPPTEADAVQTTIVGVPVWGQSTTNTGLFARLIPDEHHLRMELQTRGHVSASTTSRSGPVDLYNQSESWFTASKLVELSLSGLSASPTHIDVQTSNRLRGLRTDYDGVPVLGSFVRSYARSQHADQREQARRESEAQTSATVRRKVDAAVEAEFGQVNRALEERLMAPLRGLALEPQWLLARTTQERMMVRIRLAGDEQLGAHTPRPRAPSDSLASVQIHQSAINNLLQQLELAGRTFTVAELTAHLGKRLQLDRAPNVEDAPADLTLKFARQNAVQVVCMEGRLGLALAIEELTMEGKQWNNLLVRCVFRPETSGPTVALVRDGVVQISADRLSTRSQIVLRGLFSRVFSREGRLTLLEEPFRDLAGLRDLQMTQFVIRDGWVAAAIGPRRPAATPELVQAD